MNRLAPATISAPAIIPAISALLALSVATPASALSESQKGAISQYCGSIRQVLRSIQREDSHSRSYLGTTYETISSHYITPLNLRLVNNNLGNPALISLQSSFASQRTEFNTKFIEYSRSFEALLATDCWHNPEDFYEKLNTTRALRTEVHQITKELSATAHSAIAEIDTIKKGLE